EGGAIRVATTDDLTAYLDPSIADNHCETITHVSPSQALEEAWFLGLRLNDGVSLADIAREFGEAAIAACQPILNEASQQGLMEYDGRRATLTQQGRLFANDVFQRFLGMVESDETVASRIQQQGVFA
ncbi:MAG TPA: hypothetical protein VFN62_00895, partial [Acidobacteriaceae bacterium]|nr:hypothetical protein [Acidobacteriaceae bacterium]